MSWTARPARNPGSDSFKVSLYPNILQLTAVARPAVIQAANAKVLVGRFRMTLNIAGPRDEASIEKAKIIITKTPDEKKIAASAARVPTTTVTAC